MLIPLGPGKFYGRGLPLPRFYSDAKFNDARVDPPLPVNDPLLSWAHEAHWSMGGLSIRRLHLQGRIEGNIGNLRSQRETIGRRRNCIGFSPIKSKEGSNDDDRKVLPGSAPPALISGKRRRLTSLINDDDDDDEDEDGSNGRDETGGFSSRQGPVRKLDIEFDREAMAEGSKEFRKSKVKGKRLMKTGKKIKSHDDSFG